MKKLVLLIFSISLILTGCWGKNELGDISMVRTTGIDIDPDGSIRVTILADEPTGTASGETSTGSSTWIGSDTGSNIREAMKKLMSHSSKRPMWIHNEMIIISEEASEKILDEIMDYFVRNRTIRLDNHVLVTNKKAYEILQLPSAVQGNLTDDILGMLDNTKYWSDAYVSDLKTFAINYTDENTIPVTAEIDFYKTDMSTVSTGIESYGMLQMGPDKVGVAFIGSCVAVQKDGKLENLSHDETQGYLWIMGRVREGLVEVEGLNGEGKIVMINLDSKVEKKIKIVDDEIVFVIDLKVDGDIGIQTSKDNLKEDDLMLEVEKAFSKKIKSQIKAIVKKSQKEFETDIFGFTDLIYRKEPKKWRSIEGKWKYIYPDIKFEYNVETVIHRMGMLNESLMN